MFLTTGEDRLLGPATDIGAYEAFETPTIGDLTTTGTTPPSSIVPIAARATAQAKAVGH